MLRNLSQTPWGHFSQRFVKFQGLPVGTQLRLLDSSGRKKRTDFLVKRKPITPYTMVRVADDDTVSTLLEIARDAVSTDLSARRLKLKLYDPNGRVINGNALVRGLRADAPERPAGRLPQVEHTRDEEQLIAEIQSQAQVAITEAEYLIDDPADTVCAAYVRALVDRYGRRAVVAALGR